VQIGAGRGSVNAERVAFLLGQERRDDRFQTAQLRKGLVGGVGDRRSE